MLDGCGTRRIYDVTMMEHALLAGRARGDEQQLVGAEKGVLQRFGVGVVAAPHLNALSGELGDLSRVPHHRHDVVRRHFALERKTNGCAAEFARRAGDCD